jgi:hypothetical protein
METGNYPAGTIVDGRYRIEKRLGRGGFATVYRAEHLQLGRAAALKVLEPVAPHITERFHARFNTEARIAANLDHPNVVRIFDFGFIAPDERPYMAMELLEGMDLEEYLSSRGPMDPQRARALFLPVLDALRLGHERGIVHKDLKPSNLFVVKEGTPDEKLIVLDYGIARLEGDDNPRYTEEGTYTGTPAYMPPEYIHRREVTPAYDVYQIGLIFIETMTGQPVVKAGSQIAYMVAHVEGKHHIPEGFADTALGASLVKAISVEPGNRYPNAGAMLDAIEFATVDAGVDFTLEAITLEESEVKQITDAGERANTTQREAAPKARRRGMSGGKIFLLVFLLLAGGAGCLVVAIAGLILAVADPAREYDEMPPELTMEDFVDDALPAVPSMPVIAAYSNDGQEMQAWLLSRHMIVATLSQVKLYANLLAKTGGWTKKGAAFVPSGTDDLLGLAKSQIAIGLESPPERKKLEEAARKMQPELQKLEDTLSALYDYHSVTRGWEADGGAHGKVLTKRLKTVAESFRTSFARWSRQVDDALRRHLSAERTKHRKKDAFIGLAATALQAEHALIAALVADPLSAKSKKNLSKYDKSLAELKKHISANQAALTARYQITSGLHDRFLGSLKETRKLAGELQANARDGEDVSGDLVSISAQLHSTFDVYNQLQRF